MDQIAWSSKPVQLAALAFSEFVAYACVTPLSERPAELFADVQDGTAAFACGTIHIEDQLG
jgi:hypothetical protein